MPYEFHADTTPRKSFILPGAKPHYTPDRPGQVERIALDLDIDIANRCYDGTCTIRLNPIRNGVDRLLLDAINLQIRSVRVGDEVQPFDYDGEQLCVRLQSATEANVPLTLTIAYKVEHPQRGIYFIAPDDRYPDKPVQVWTQGEDEDSRFWFPCFDYPGQLAASEIRVRVPKAFTAISNGELVSVEEDKKYKVFHWKQEEVHPTYLMTLAIGEFAEIRDEWNGKPVTYYAEKDRIEDARRSMAKTPKAMAFFSEIFGYDYPYPKYAQVCVADFIFGGMENTSATLLTDRCLLDDRAAIDNDRTESLVVHELAHQWFGDLVVIKHWSHAWVKEGMASYAEVLWWEREYGREDAAFYMLGEMRSYLNEDRSRYRRPMVTHIYREPIELYDRHIYEKGACVYHMIRAELGNELFFKAIATFVNDNAHQAVETVDLLRAIEKSTGRNLSPLFDQYVLRGGHPDFKVSYSWDGDSNLAKVTVVQTQAKEQEDGTIADLFDLHIPIAFGYNAPDKTRLHTVNVRLHEKEQTFYFPLLEKPQFVSFDSGNCYLKTVRLEYPFAELKAQAQYDPDPISRIHALKFVAKKGTAEATKVLLHSLKHDRCWGVRAEAASHLATLQTAIAIDGLLVGLNDENPRVRKAVAGALGKVKTNDSYKILKSLLKKGDESYYVEATAAKAIGSVVAPHLDPKLTEKKALNLLSWVLKEKAGWNEVVRSGAIAGLSEFKTSADALDLVLKCTEQGTPQALRLAAIRALGSISTGQEKHQVDRILERLGQLANETFYLVQTAVVSSLSKMETQKAIDVAQTLADRSTDSRVKRVAEEAISTLRDKCAPDKAVKNLRRDLDRLQKENRELRDRLDALEAKTKA